jgi:hypothetical protein
MFSFTLKYRKTSPYTHTQPFFFFFGFGFFSEDIKLDQKNHLYFKDEYHLYTQVYPLFKQNVMKHVQYIHC